MKRSLSARSLLSFKQKFLFRWLLFPSRELTTLVQHHGSSAKLMKQRKRRLLVDNHRTIEYAWRAASAKTETFAKTVKNPLIAPHPRIINFAEDPASYGLVSLYPIVKKLPANLMLGMIQ